MFHNLFRGVSAEAIQGASLTAFWLILLNLAFNVLSNSGFRMSAFSPSWRGFLVWQIVGNVAGFITVLTLTALLRYMPLGVAFPLTTGLAIVGVELIGAAWLFQEPITQRQWLGTLAIVAGIWLLRA